MVPAWRLTRYAALLAVSVPAPAEAAPTPLLSAAVPGEAPSLNRSDNALTATLKLTADTFEFADPTGQSYVARLDGTQTPIKGDLGHTTVSVRRVTDNEVEETDRRGGKIVEVTRFVVAADGKTMRLTIEDKLKGGSRHFVAVKQ